MIPSVVFIDIAILDQKYLANESTLAHFLNFNIFLEAKSHI